MCHKMDGTFQVFTESKNKQFVSLIMSKMKGTFIETFERQQSKSELSLEIKPASKSVLKIKVIGSFWLDIKCNPTAAFWTPEFFLKEIMKV